MLLLGMRSDYDNGGNCQNELLPTLRSENERSNPMILLFILIILAGFLLHDAATIALDHVDWLVMFTERHDDD